MDPKTSSRVSLIVSVADNPTALDLVMEGISLQTRVPAEILIADDGSDDQTVEVIERWKRRLPCRIVRRWYPHETFRRSVALNALVRASTGDYLVFLDGDCVPHRKFIADHLRHAERGAFVQGRRGGIRARFVKRFSPRQIRPVRLFLRGHLYALRRGLRRPWPTVQVGPRCYILGSNLAIWRDDFFRVNGFDETVAGPAQADTELADRLSNAGIKCKKVIGQLVVYHLDHPRVVRYVTAANDLIVERTRRERRTRCDVGVTDGYTGRDHGNPALAM